MRNAPLMQTGNCINYGGEKRDNFRLPQAPAFFFYFFVAAHHQVLKQGLLRLLCHDVGEVFVLKEIDKAECSWYAGGFLEHAHLLLSLFPDWLWSIKWNLL